MAVPTTDYNWATNLAIDYITNPDGSGAVLVLNKVEPDVAIKQSGIRANQPPARGNYNYNLNSHGVWIDWLRKGEIDDIYQTANTATTASEVETMFGGTWTDLGTDTLFGISIRGFRRTA